MMKRLFAIEWEKLKSYRAFWIMVGLYVLILALVIFGLPSALDYIAAKTDNNIAIKAFKLIVFNFPDIWQNITYVVGMRSFIKIILAIIVVIIITNEFSFLTVRINILSGLSRSEFLAGKILIIFLLTLISTLAVFLSGLYLGITNTPTISFHAIVGKTYYLLAYFIEVFTYLLFALLVGILLRKTGFAVIILLIFPFIELIAQSFLPDYLEKFLPLNAMNQIIWSPNTSLITVKTPEFNMDFQEYIAIADVGVCLLYAALFAGILYLYIQKKDL